MIINQQIKQKRGFTLIELLVVVAIIGLLSSVVLASLNSARAKARDANRIAGIKQIQIALELYYDAHGRYPGKDNANGEYYYARTSSNPSGCGLPIYSPYLDSWCALELALKPYISTLPRDPRGNQDIYYFTYKYYPNLPGPNSYGLGAVLENSSSLSQNDGGYNLTWFEVGDFPAYCYNKYSGASGNWTNWSYSQNCVGGN